MDYIKRILSSKFGDEFAYLKLLEVVYSNFENLCTIVFLYPENVRDLIEEERDRITNVLTEELKLAAKIKVKFKKSFLDNDLIIREADSFFKTRYSSLYAGIEISKIKISKDFMNIELTVPLEKNSFDYATSNGINKILPEFLSSRFCANFTARFEKDDSIVIDEFIMEKMYREMMEKCAKETVIIPRYEVVFIEKIFGADFAMAPEFISNNKKEKEAVILAGKISEFAKKEYVSKKPKDKGKIKHYYMFMLDDGTGRMDVRYFSSETNEKKMDNLKDGDSVAILGNLRLFGTKISLHIKSICRCEIPETKKEIKREFKESNFYETVFPKPFESSYQDNLFKAIKKYRADFLNGTYVVYDLETTGLSYQDDEIIEIGGVKIKNGVIVESFSTLVKPTKPISAAASAVNGITDDMVKDAPDCYKALKDFFLFAKNSYIVGYNNSGFDDKFLAYNSKKYMLEFENESLDVITMAREKLALPNYKLKTVANRLDVSLDNAHRALCDCIATAEIFIKFHELA